MAFSLNMKIITKILLVLIALVNFGFGQAPQARAQVSGSSIGLITQKSFEEPGCVAWNSYDGNAFNGVLNSSASWTDGATNSLCGANDSWVGFGAGYIAGLYREELVVNNSNCYGNTGNCMRYRVVEGQNPPGNGLFKVTFADTPTLFVSQKFKVPSNLKWVYNGAYTPEPSWIKWVDVNDFLSGGNSGARVILGFGQGGACIAIVTPGSYGYYDKCNAGPSPYAGLVPGSWYCYAMYVDLENDIRRAWLGPVGGTVTKIQDDASRDLNLGINRFRFLHFFTNQSLADTNGDPTTVSQTSAADQAPIYIDDVVIAQQQPPNVDCALTTASGGNPPTPPPTPPSGTPVVGDINLDHIVNSLDYSILNSNWFTNNAASDLNHDGIVNSLDYSILNSHWFQTW